MVTDSIENYREILRDLFRNERNLILKGYWLAMGLELNELIKEGNFFLIDKADENFEKKLLERMTKHHDWSSFRF
ncbi:hypothetical protein [Macrococcoides bohemicum]|uniref:hypothetical protein n=1 Tax=Macrococcoides bohemicum TaxID=1903056 RepID=UPI00165E2B0E|nr:hypothetical protein [Macrococcus bohemicus]MBC9873858.1 hypothetical protein [Macrococcus bohemicus]